MMAANRERVNTLRVKTLKKDRGSCYSSMESEADEDELNGQRDLNLELPESRPRAESGVSVSSHGRSSRDESLSPVRRPIERCNMGTSEENDEGIVADQTKQTRAATETQIDQRASKKLEITLQLEHSFKLFRPLTALTYFNKDCCLISGSFGMVHIWDTANNLIKQSLQVAGEVNSLDAWTECLAVGSEVVQIFQLGDKRPKRIIYAKRGELMTKTRTVKHLVAFVGNEGYLASAKVGGDTISIWPPPPAKSYAVTKSLYDMDVKGSSIVSMTASKDPDNPWVAVVTSNSSFRQLHETLHLWNCSWTTKAPQIHTSPLTSSASCKIYLSFLQTGRSIAIGNGRNLHIMKCENGQMLKTKTLENDITCLTYKPESQNSFIAVCTDDGKISLYDTERLDELCKISTSQNSDVDVMHVFQNETSLLFVSYKDTLQIWNDQLRTNDQTEPPRHCLGMELCSEGILSQRSVLPINELQSLNLSFEEHDVHLELPEELLQEKSSLEVAFAPYNNAGPFEFPEGIIPVSPLVWFCLHPQKSSAFMNPASVKLPLCFDCKTKEDTKLLCMLKAEHKDITVNEDGQTVVRFNTVDQKKSQFLPDSPYGILRDHHFCIYCVGFSSLKEDVLKKVRYCLTIQKPIAFPKGKKKEIYCILHYNLPGCKELIKQQMPEDYEVHTETSMQFDNLEAALELTVDKADAQGKGWTIALVSKKLFIDDVNFFNLYELGTLESDCNENKYPPRMVIEVSSDSSVTVFQSKIKLTFTGARREFPTEISLSSPLNGEHLHTLDCERQNQGCGPTDRTPLPFFGQPNP